MQLTPIIFLILSASIGSFFNYVFQNKEDYIWINNQDEESTFKFQPNYPLPKEIHYTLDEVSRDDIFIPVKGLKSNATIHGWLFLPVEEEDNQKPKPLVIVSHGLGGQKDMGLESYGANFAKAGFASLLIDYQHFGGSTSDAPLRNWINPWNHVDDIIQVIESVESGVLGPRVRTDAIALWGTSFSGGHMLVVTEELKKRNKDSSIKCIISQVPHLDGKAASQRGLKQRGLLGTLKLAVFALTDLIGSFFNAPPLYIKIVGVDDDTAYMVLTKDQRDSYFRKHPKVYLGGWKNWAPARTSALISLYSPKTSVPAIEQPILFIGAKHDVLCPMDSIKEAAKTAKKAKVMEIETNHFNIYSGEHLENATIEMIKFLKKHLRRPANKSD